MSQVAPADTPQAVGIRSKRRTIIMLWLGLLICTVVCLVLSQIWRPDFLAGKTPGPYWLLIIYNFNTLLLIGIGLLCALLFILAVAGEYVPDRHQELFRQNKWALITFLILAELFTGYASFRLVLDNYRHSETANITGHIYQTAIYHDLFGDERPTVFQCDQFGLWCHLIYFLPETDTPSLAWTRLRAGEDTGTLSLEICWKYIRYAGSSICETRQIQLTQGDSP